MNNIPEISVRTETVILFKVRTVVYSGRFKLTASTLYLQLCTKVQLTRPRDEVVVADVAAPPLTISLTRGTSARLHIRRSEPKVCSHANFSCGS